MAMDESSNRAGSPAAVTVYGAFTCPYSYLASLRSTELDPESLAADWRMVTQGPRLPAGGRRLDDHARRELEAELDDVRALLLPGKEFPLNTPSFVPNTNATVAGYAEAYGAGVADEVRTVLFHAYWVDGADIGNPEILRRLLADPIRRGHSTSWALRDFGYAVSIAGGPITSEAYYRVRDWHAQWQQLSGGVVPILKSGDTLAVGVDAVTRLGDALQRSAPAHDDVVSSETAVSGARRS
jgi:hypothetical protein